MLDKSPVYRKRGCNFIGLFWIFLGVFTPPHDPTRFLNWRLTLIKMHNFQEMGDFDYLSLSLLLYLRNILYITAAVMLPCVPCFTNFCRPLAMRFAVGRSTMDVNSSRMSTDDVSMANTRAMCARASSPQGRQGWNIWQGMVETVEI